MCEYTLLYINCEVLIKAFEVQVFAQKELKLEVKLNDLEVKVVDNFNH